ncbi:hypothetical protein VdG1_07930 [Verticillium dahliae VDG1]|nr:hypothetical protein VdG1_07930 [Verticillium dahliae VDG1]
MGSAIAMSDAVDLATFWPLASKHILYTGVPPSPFIITKTKGTRLYDSTGRAILDFTSGQMSSLIGHAHPEIAAVINHHAANLDHLLSNMLTQPYWCVGDVRGKGLLQGIEIISDAETKAPGLELGQAVSERAMERGLSCNVVNLPGMGGVFRLAPPVTVTEDEIAEGLAILDEAFEYVLNQQKKP